jgi:hypothetical protein
MGLLAASVAHPQEAGPWSIEPRLGVETDYASNPLLHETDVHAEEHIAATIDLPLRYDTNEWEFLLRPNGRITNSQGYATLASNYEHLDGAAQYNDELNSVALQGEAARDSSLYYIGGLLNRIGVPRDTGTTSADWTHMMTALTKFQLDASWMRVRYDEPAGVNALIDYRYWSAGPTFSVAMSERDTLKLLGSYGSYNSLNGLTESKSENLQLGFVRQLTEIWTLSTGAGYSRSVNSQKIYLFGFYFLGTETSKQTGAVYSASLTRQGEKFSFSGGVSRALQPTGLAYLSTQDGVNVNGTYTHSEHWDFALSAAWLKALNPQVSAGLAQLNSRELTMHYLNTQLVANWHWTPQWIVSMAVTRLTQQYGPPTVSAGSTGVSLSLVRQFLRTQF